MSPEQLHGVPVSAQSDQFSLGITAYELLTGALPFDGDGLIIQLLNEPAPPVSTHVPSLGSAVDEALSKAMAKKAAGRYPSCGAFVDALEQSFLVSSPVSRPSGRKAVPSQRLRVGILAGATTLVLIAGVGLAVKKPWESPAEPPGSGTGAKQPTAEVKQPPPDPTPLDPPATEPARQPVRSSAAAKQTTPQSKSTAAQPAPEPPPPVSGIAPVRPDQRTGTIVWIGKLDQGAELTIDRMQCSMGQVTRELPGSPVDIVNVVPRSVSLLEAPGAENNWRKMRLRNDGRAEIDSFIVTYVAR
jgi:serine/threonine protein kinase